MDPTGFHANMNYSVRLSDLKPPRNAVDDLTGKLRAMIKPFRRRSITGQERTPSAAEECIREPPDRLLA